MPKTPEIQLYVSEIIIYLYEQRYDWLFCAKIRTGLFLGEHHLKKMISLQLSLFILFLTDILLLIIPTEWPVNIFIFVLLCHSMQFIIVHGVSSLMFFQKLLFPFHCSYSLTGKLPVECLMNVLTCFSWIKFNVFSWAVCCHQI